MTSTIKKYAGTTGNLYQDVATRGSEVLGLNLEYGIAGGSGGIGALVVRFVVRSETNAYEEFKHLTLREEVQFNELNADGQRTGEKFRALRLNKVGIPVFNPGPEKKDVLAFAEAAGVIPIIASWVREQIAVEGFELVDAVYANNVTEKISDVIEYLVAEAFTVRIPDPKMILQFPDLEEQKKPAPVAVVPTDDDDADPDDDPDDEDEDEDDDDDEDENLD